MTQHGFVHSAATRASQTDAQHSERSPDLNHLSPQLAPYIHPLQHRPSTSPTLPPEKAPTHPEPSDTEVTPPTSSSGFSSQERPVLVGQNCSIPSSHYVSSKALRALTIESSAACPNKAEHFREPVAAPKRTSSGHIKRSSISGRGAPQNTHAGTSAHARTSSLLSNGSSVAEVGFSPRIAALRSDFGRQLSHQLRTRLSYAMVKVQHGWESNTLEEIESFASPHGSPRSSLTAIPPRPRGQTLQSPAAAMAPTLRRQGSSGISSEDVLARPRRHQVDDEALGPSVPKQRAINRQQRRALAPPADIVPGTRRRTHHANEPPNGYRSVNSPGRTGTKQRTASQNAAMEADAVETLLFMASPGNSSHHPSASSRMASSSRMSAPASSQTSPFKSEFPSQELLTSPHRRVAFADSSNTSHRTADLPSPCHDVDRMIDEMDDISNDSELEYINDPRSQRAGGENAVST